jgi:hypothetical protein
MPSTEAIDDEFVPEIEMPQGVNAAGVVVGVTGAR